MKLGFLLLVPVALTAIVFAQESEDAKALVKQLGSEDYAVREAAQKSLVEMGEKAVPALEEALNSEDLEVRLRAGRALRAIGGAAKKTEPVEEPAQEEPQTRGQFQGMSMSMGNGKVIVKITEMVDGKLETKTYEGKSLEELKEKHPELKQHLDGRFQVRFGKPDDFDMDMDRFWKDWNQNLTGFDEDIRVRLEESRRQMEAMRRWMDQYRVQQRRGGVTLPGAMLGVRAYEVPAVLDAQLDLRGRGIVVEAVEKGSLADRLGIERFDILLELNGKEVHTADDVALALHGRGEAKATAKVVRRAQPQTLNEADAAAPK